MKSSSSIVNALIIFVIVIAILYFAREVLIPVALAGILSFMLAPPVRMLQNLRFPRGVAVIAVVLLAFTGIFALGGVMAHQEPAWPEICHVTRRQSARKLSASAAAEKLEHLGGRNRFSKSLARNLVIQRRSLLDLCKPTWSPERMKRSSRLKSTNQGVVLWRRCAALSPHCLVR